ncbi:MAG TPA: class I SAM-dependent methyltransferase [Syntrophales bacterium]|nr:class I SAM-dependent methyltransferase [Syntrophales bacterium]
MSFYHSTRDYHLRDLKTLGWELTVCNSLQPQDSPCRAVLKRGNSYGNLLYDFLDRLLPMESVGKVLEIGGGYGYLMRDFLNRNSRLQACMLDISPALLNRQRENLKPFPVRYRQEDFLETDTASLGEFDLAILNENLGDFPVLANIENKSPGCSPDAPAREVKRIFDMYGLEEPSSGPFNFNLGAAQAVEKLCSSGIRYLFLSEHSCEAAAPGICARLRVRSTGMPERISLYGHAEYTVKFSHLQKIAARFGYASMRGPLADFIEPDFTPGLIFIITSGATVRDEHEIIRQFVEDLYQYEYLVLQAG